MPIANIIENIEQNYLKLTETCKLDLTKASRVVEVCREKQLVKEGQHARNIYFIAQEAARKLQKYLEKVENLESFRLPSSVFRPDNQREFSL
jgi:hypothetical protein